MIYSASLQNLFLGRGLLVPMGMTTNGTSNVTVSMTVYEGTQPNCNTIIQNWGTYNTSYLLHQTGVLINQPNFNTSSNGNYITLSALPAAQTASNTGNANWVIIWTNNLEEANVNEAIIPSNTFIVGPVSNVYSNGVIKYSNTYFESANTYNIADFIITVSLVS